MTAGAGSRLSPYIPCQPQTSDSDTQTPGREEHAPNGKQAWRLPETARALCPFGEAGLHSKPSGSSDPVWPVTLTELQWSCLRSAEPVLANFSRALGANLSLRLGIARERVCLFPSAG